MRVKVIRDFAVAKFLFLYIYCYCCLAKYIIHTLINYASRGTYIAGLMNYLTNNNEELETLLSISRRDCSIHVCSRGFSFKKASRPSFLIIFIESTIVRLKPTRIEPRWLVLHPGDGKIFDEDGRDDALSFKRTGG